jgi:hypothetical protein
MRCRRSTCKFMRNPIKLCDLDHKRPETTLCGHPLPQLA